MTVPSALVHDERANAVAVWALTAVVVWAALRSARVGEALWGGVALVIALALAAPAVATRDATTVVPWPLALVAAAAVTVRAAGRLPETAGYVAIASLAMVAVVELDAFTAVDMSRRFAVVFAVLATLATQAVWTVAQFYSDRWLGSEYLATQAELQWDIVTVTAVAAVLGVLSDWYLRRIGYDGSRDGLSGEGEST